MIPDTSGQDLSSPQPTRRPAIAVAWPGSPQRPSACSLVALLLSGWLGSERSVDVVPPSHRRGHPRHADARCLGQWPGGRGGQPDPVCARRGTVTLKIHAGDKVSKGDLLAVLDSPDLSNQLAREQSTPRPAGSRGRAPAHPGAETEADRAPRRRRGRGRAPRRRAHPAAHRGRLQGRRDCRDGPAARAGRAEVRRDPQQAGRTGLGPGDHRMSRLQTSTKLSELQRQRLVPSPTCSGAWMN